MEFNYLTNPAPEQLIDYLNQGWEILCQYTSNYIGTAQEEVPQIAQIINGTTFGIYNPPVFKNTPISQFTTYFIIKRSQQAKVLYGKS